MCIKRIRCGIEVSRFLFVFLQLFVNLQPVWCIILAHYILWDGFRNSVNPILNHKVTWCFVLGDLVYEGPSLVSDIKITVRPWSPHPRLLTSAVTANTECCADVWGSETLLLNVLWEAKAWECWSIVLLGALHLTNSDIVLKFIQGSTGALWRRVRSKCDKKKLYENFMQLHGGKMKLVTQIVW